MNNGKSPSNSRFNFPTQNKIMFNLSHFLVLSEFIDLNPLSDNNLNTFADELFGCFSPFCGVGAYRVKQAANIKHFIALEEIK